MAKLFLTTLLLAHVLTAAHVVRVGGGGGINLDSVNTLHVAVTT